jgi:hypothetical protein
MSSTLKEGKHKEKNALTEQKLSTCPEKPFDAKKFNGTLKVKGEALIIQQKLRLEWERNNH